jgi:hypothetical protein
MITGYETRDHVLAQLAALDAEVPKNEAHAAEIEKQRALFQSEAERFEAEEIARLEHEHQARLEAAKASAASRRR